MTAVPVATTDDYLALLIRYRPPGVALPSNIDSNYAKLLSGVAPEFSRVDNRARDLPEEADPRTTVELLDDWEVTYGLPEPCSAGAIETNDITARQKRLHGKVIARGGQDRFYFTRLCAALGVEVKIHSCHLRRHGRGRHGGRHYGLKWEGWWIAETTLTDLVVRRHGDRHGGRYRTWGDTLIRCALEKHKPAQTEVLISFIEENGA